MRNSRGLVVALSLGLTACAGPQGLLFSQVAATITALPPDRTRIYFYRDYEPYDSLSRAAILLNGAPAGVSSAGAVFFRDLPPAAYEIAVPTPGSDWRSLMIVTRPGETVYVKVESLRAWQSGGADSNYERDTFVAVNVDPAQAQRELTYARYLQSEGS